MMTRQSSPSGALVPSITASLLLSLYVVHGSLEVSAAPIPEQDAKASKRPLPAPYHDVEWGPSEATSLSSPGLKHADAPEAKPTIDVIVKPLAPLNAQTPEEIERNAIRVVATPPKYPERQAAQGIEGWVLVEFDISPEGKVQNAQVVESKPALVFDQSALRAVQKWQYEPKLVGGEPAYEYGVRQQINFEVKKD